MREEITEPKHWRKASERPTHRSKSWATKRHAEQRNDERNELSVDALDAALELVADEPVIESQPTTTEVVSNLSRHLELLEKQREQIQQLLDEAQGS